MTTLRKDGRLRSNYAYKTPTKQRRPANTSRTLKNTKMPSVPRTRQTSRNTSDGEGLILIFVGLFYLVKFIFKGFKFLFTSLLRRS